jgi:hypothetical protein
MRKIIYVRVFVGLLLISSLVNVNSKKEDLCKPNDDESCFVIRCLKKDSILFEKIFNYVCFLVDRGIITFKHGIDFISQIELDTDAFEKEIDKVGK